MVATPVLGRAWRRHFVYRCVFISGECADPLHTIFAHCSVSHVQPPTFVLPKEYLAFAESFGRNRTAGSAAGGAASLDALSRLLLSVDGASTPSHAIPPPTDPNLWIMKPVGLSRGRGISLISDMAQVRSSSCLNALFIAHCHSSGFP